MKGQDLYDALGQVGGDLIEKSAPGAAQNKTKSAKTLRFRVIAIAAAVLVAAAAVIVPIAVTMNKAPGSDPGAELPSFPLVDLRGGEPGTIKDQPGVLSSAGEQGEPPMMEFPYDKDEFIVKVRCIGICPDFYTVPCWGGNGSLLVKFTVLEEIYGSGLPEVLYVSFGFQGWAGNVAAEALSHYDAFYIAVKQVCPDQTPFVNCTTGKVEIFNNLFKCAGRRDNGAIVAVKDGKIDTALWDEPGWSNLSEVDDYLEWDLKLENGANSTDEELRAALTRKHKADDPGPSFITRATFAGLPEAEKLFDYTDNGGFFSALVENGKTLTYRRLINGYYTTEIIRFAGDGVTRTLPFTEDDLARLPDLETMEKELFSNNDLPLRRDKEKAVVVNRSNVQCWYVKTDKGLFGVCKKVFDFSYIDYGDHVSVAVYHDDLYWYSDSSGLCRIAERKDLAAATGSDEFIETYRYYEEDATD